MARISLSKLNQIQTQGANAADRNRNWTAALSEMCVDPRGGDMELVKKLRAARDLLAESRALHADALALTAEVKVALERRKAAKA